MHQQRRKLEVEDDIQFERKNWKAERIAWFAMLLVVLAGLSGALGRGGISAQTATSTPAGLTLEYERFLRYETTDELRLTLQPKGNGNSYRVLLGKEMLDKVHLEKISPEPESEEVSEKGITYTFKTYPQQNELVLRLWVKPFSWGNLKTELLDSDGRRITLSQFIYP